MAPTFPPPPLRVWGGLSWESCKSVPGCYGGIEDTCSRSKASTYTCAFKTTSCYTQERISSFSLVKQMSSLYSHHTPRPTVTSLHAVLYFLFAQQKNFCNSRGQAVFLTAERDVEPDSCSAPTFSPQLRQPHRNFRVGSGTRSALLRHNEWTLKTTPPLKMAL